MRCTKRINYTIQLCSLPLNPTYMTIKLCELHTFGEAIYNSSNKKLKRFIKKTRKDMCLSKHLPIRYGGGGHSMLKGTQLYRRYFNILAGFFPSIVFLVIFALRNFYVVSVKFVYCITLRVLRYPKPHHIQLCVFLQVILQTLCAIVKLNTARTLLPD